MSKTLFIVNYWTDAWYWFEKWDKSYARSILWAKKVIKWLLESEGYNQATIKEILRPLDIWIMNKKTMLHPGWIPDLEYKPDDLYIGIYQAPLF